MSSNQKSDLWLSTRPQIMCFPFSPPQPGANQKRSRDGTLYSYWLTLSAVKTESFKYIIYKLHYTIYNLPIDQYCL